MIKTTLFLRISAAFLLLVAGACSGSEAGSTDRNMGGRNFGGAPDRFGAEEEAVSVKAFRASRQPISTFILSNTSLESIRKVTVFARVNALVEELFVEEGDAVRRNQALARLDDREVLNELEQAQIALQQSQLSLEQAEVRSELSQANYERARSLAEQRLISQQEFDQAALTNRTDALALKVAGQQAEGAAARVEASRIQLDFTEIQSPLEGVVTERLIEVGTRVSPNEAVFTVEDFSPLWARIYVPEKELPQLRLGQTARLQVQAFPEERFEGSIHMISPRVDPESGTVKVTLEVRDGRRLLRPGMFGTVYIATETHPAAVVIPKRAVLRERDENRVFVIKPDNTVEKRVVALGFSEEDAVEVLSGVQEGEVVVTVGLEGLNDGYPVSVLAWEGEAAVPPGAAPEPVAPETVRQQAGIPPSDQPVQRPGGRESGSFSPDQMKQFLERMMRNPQVKEAYDERVKGNPDFAADPEQLRAFLQEMREKMGRVRQ